MRTGRLHAGAGDTIRDCCDVLVAREPLDLGITSISRTAARLRALRPRLATVWRAPQNSPQQSSQARSQHAIVTRLQRVRPVVVQRQAGCELEGTRLFRIPDCPRLHLFARRTPPCQIVRTVYAVLNSTRATHTSDIGKASL
jgi:hypothetical protein